MPLETATYISDLVVTNPANSDGLNQADDHMRLIKATVKTTFPNISGAVTGTHTELNGLTDRLVDGAFRGNGAVPAGAIMDFAMATAPTGWLECTGAAVSRTTYADLFTAIGTTWGAGDGSTTFNLPPDRYRVGRTTAAAAVGTLQASQNKSHTHTGSGNTGNISADHTHTFAGTTGLMNSNASHTHSSNAPSSTIYTASAADGPFGFPQAGTSATINATNTDHDHPFSGTTSGVSSNHTHAFSFTTSVGSADGTEARPLSATVLTCIKT